MPSKNKSGINQLGGPEVQVISEENIGNSSKTI